MLPPFSHPSSDKLLRKVFDVFSSKKVFQRKNRHIIFVCGGSVQPRSRSMRHRFLKYSRDSIENFRFFLAEAATQDLTQHGEPQFINIADFETLVAEVSDCILLFPESAGSIAEIGFFANSTKAVKKLLVVNDLTMQSDSFINIGLIDRINNKSIFRPIIITRYNQPDFPQIRERLISRLPAKTGKKFDFIKYYELNVQQRLFVIFQLIYIFKALKYESIIKSLTTIFGHIDNETEINHLISILVAAKYLERRGDDLEYFIPSAGAEPFLEFRNFDIQELQADVVAFYEEYHRETYDIIGEVSR
jgi:hypothetical protein